MSDDALQSTDASASADTSGPEQIADSFDGSDTDNSEVMPNSEPTPGHSDGSVSDTDSLTAGRCRQRGRGGIGVVQDRPAHNGLNSSLNPQASMLAPTSSAHLPACAGQSGGPQLRQSIRAVIRALEQWEESAAPEEADVGSQDVASPGGTLQSQTLGVLEEAISTLTTQDARMVQAFLDAKMGTNRAGHQQAQSGMTLTAPPGLDHPTAPSLLADYVSSPFVMPQSKLSRPQASMAPQAWVSDCLTGTGNHRSKTKQGSAQAARGRPDKKQSRLSVPGHSLSANSRELALIEPTRVLMLRMHRRSSPMERNMM